MVRRVGIIGFGHLGQFLVSKITHDDDFELAFVWNRTKSVLENALNGTLILDDLDHFALRKPDIVIEVAHPSITESHGEAILKYCDYMIGSPTALSNATLLKALKESATTNGLYVPSGALWGGEDIQKMADAGIIKVCKLNISGIFMLYIWNAKKF